MDAFGEPLTLNLKGESSFNTAAGGLITLFTYAVVMALTLTLFEEMLIYKEPTIQTYEIGELPSSEEPRNLLEQKMIITVKVYGFENEEIDPRVGKLEVHRPN
mmetsp:Transcript_15042/g.20427  ORF Transcript_15042/g.20427 Transcript_15042/m.20427 type:complete len:103 (-) Transcript_15042:1336-1644(-)